VRVVSHPLGGRGRSVAAAVLASGLLLGGFGAARAPAATPATTESYQALLGQISAGQVRSAVINRKPHTIKVTLDDGSVQRIDYPPADEKRLSNSLRKHGAVVKIAKKKKAKKAVHHRLRYIAAGIVGVVVVVGLVLLILRGRRPPEPVREPEPAPTAPPPPPGGPPEPPPA
jgi:ATP-dependent Zn protease